MSILITISLGTLVIIALVSILTGGNFETILSQNVINPNVNNSNSIFQLSDISTTFYIDEFTGALVIIIALIGVVLLIGIRVLNTGLSDESIRTATIFIGYLSLWLVFSALSYQLIIEIEIIGGFLYIFMTIIYTIGVFQKTQR